MITLPPYILERDAYHLTPVIDRWIFNKLQVAERMGYECGPAGTWFTPQDVIVRPIMNLAGMGTGGVYPRTLPVGGPDADREGSFIAGKHHPGHCWVEKFTGAWEFATYINDVAIGGCSGAPDQSQDGNPNHFIFTELDPGLLPALPVEFHGLSRYMMAEFRGGNVLEVAPRSYVMNMRQYVIDDYLTIDPSYTVKAGQLGLTDMLKVDIGNGGYRWSSMEETRRPFVNNP